MRKGTIKTRGQLLEKFNLSEEDKTYSDNEIVGPLVPQISWSNNVVILKRTKSIEEKEFYLRLCISNNYTKRELIRQIDSGYYQRFLLSKKEFPLKEGCIKND